MALFTIFILIPKEQITFKKMATANPGHFPDPAPTGPGIRKHCAVEETRRILRID